MSTNNTATLGLHSWEAEDRVLREEMNENFTILDAEIASIRDDVQNALVFSDVEPPTDTDKLWIDTSGEYNVLKRFNGSEWLRIGTNEAVHILLSDEAKTAITAENVDAAIVQLVALIEGVEELAQSKAAINDSVASATETYSSTKIEQKVSAATAPKLDKLAKRTFFEAKLSSKFTLIDNTIKKVPFTVLSGLGANSPGSFNPPTQEFTVGADGVHLVEFYPWLVGLGANRWYYTALLVNGVEYRFNQGIAVQQYNTSGNLVNGAFMPNFSTAIDLKTGDKVCFVIYADVQDNTSVYLDAFATRAKITQLY